MKVDRLEATVEHGSSLSWTRLSVGALTRLINTPNRSGATCEASDSKPVQKRESRLRFVQNNRVSRDTRQKERERVEKEKKGERVLSMAFRPRAPAFHLLVSVSNFHVRRVPTWYLCPSPRLRRSVPVPGSPILFGFYLCNRPRDAREGMQNR